MLVGCSLGEMVIMASWATATRRARVSLESSKHLMTRLFVELCHITSTLWRKWQQVLPKRCQPPAACWLPTCAPCFNLGCIRMSCLLYLAGRRSPLTKPFFLLVVSTFGVCLCAFWLQHALRVWPASSFCMKCVCSPPGPCLLLACLRLPRTRYSGRSARMLCGFCECASV